METDQSRIIIIVWQAGILRRLWRATFGKIPQCEDCKFFVKRAIPPDACSMPFTTEMIERNRKELCGVARRLHCKTTGIYFTPKETNKE